MPNEVSIFEPRTMGKLISRLPPVHTFFISTFFKNIITFNTKSVDVDFKKGNRSLAPFVHPKIGGKTVPNSGYRTENYTPPMLAPNKITTVDDLLDRMPGENPYSGKSPAERAVEKIARDFTELDEMISRRLEWMGTQAITTGKIPIIGDGLNEEIDFNFTNKETLAASKKWSAAGTDPIADLRRWKKAVQKSGFVNCNVCIMSDDVVAAFLQNPIVQKMLDIKSYDLAVIKPKELVNGVTYIGTLHMEGIDIYSYNEWYLDNWTDENVPEQKPLIPDGTVILLSSAADYSVYYGTVTLLDSNTKNFYSVEGVRVPDSWIEQNPPRRFLQLNSRPLPVPHEVDSWFVAKVL